MRTCQRLKEALIDIFAHQDPHGPAAADRDAMQAKLLGRGFADVITRMRRAVTNAAVWGAGQDAAAGRRAGHLEAAHRLASSMEFPN